jgi:hypothetical protein
MPPLPLAVIATASAAKREAIQNASHAEEAAMLDCFVGFASSQ